MIKLFTLTTLAIAITACASPQQACTSYGYTQGTAAYAGCVERRSRDTAAAGARMSTLLDVPAYPTPPMLPPRREVICQAYGNQFRCW